MTRRHVWLLLLCACGRETAPARPPAQDEAALPGAPPTARPEVYEQMRADLQASRHPSDGGGRAWLEPGEPAVAAQPGQWTLHYEAGPLGIAAGGALYFQVSPFWGWSTPQVEEAEHAGYTVVTTEAAGVTLEARTLDQQLLGIEIRGRALAAGERVTLRYSGLADRFAEASSRFWFAVDGDGDGVRRVLDDSPALPVLPGAPRRLSLLVSSTARPGAPVRAHLAVLDRDGNAGVPFVGTIALSVAGGAWELPAEVVFTPADGGVRVLELAAPESGIYRLVAEGDELRAESNPLVVAGESPRILWADLHGHSGVSDGTGTPDDYYRYARDVSGLDAVALTDHDHWGLLFMDQHPELWREQQEAAARWHEPGRLVTLPGYEWTNWIFGHRHVLLFADGGPLLSSLDERYDTPGELWAGLRGLPALTLAHHSAGSTIATDWSIAPDPELEPITEIVSVHGSSEAADSPRRIGGAVARNFVRDALGRGYRLGFAGSGDSHDGHPGLAHLASPCGGLAAVLSEDCTRTGVLEALRARRCYATSGARIVLRAALDGARMGSILRADSASMELVVSVIGTAPIESVDVLRGGEIVNRIPGEGRRELAAQCAIEALRAGEWLYLRVVQADQHAAWSSPFYLE